MSEAENNLSDTEGQQQPEEATDSLSYADWYEQKLEEALYNAKESLNRPLSATEECHLAGNLLRSMFEDLGDSMGAGITHIILDGIKERLGFGAKKWIFDNIVKKKAPNGLGTPGSNGNSGTGFDPASLPLVVDADDYITTSPPAVHPVIKDRFDVGDKILIVGSSKARKSFFALQLALSLATGRKFLDAFVPQPRKTLLMQLEIQDNHFHRRVNRMCEAFDLDSLKGNLAIVNGRGAIKDMEAVSYYVNQVKPEVLIIDPIYKLLEGDENTAEAWRETLRGFDLICQKHKTAVIYVHHDAKGVPGLRSLIDRGSGSGIIGRDYDAMFALTNHRDELDTLVLEQLCRNYKSPEAQSIQWEDYKFITTSVAPVVETKVKAHKGSAIAFDTQVELALCSFVPNMADDADNLIIRSDLSLTAFKDSVARVTGSGQRTAKNICQRLEEDGLIERRRIRERGPFVVNLSSNGRSRVMDLHGKETMKRFFTTTEAERQGNEKIDDDTARNQTELW